MDCRLAPWIRKGKRQLVSWQRQALLRCGGRGRRLRDVSDTLQEDIDRRTDRAPSQVTDKLAGRPAVDAVHLIRSDPAR
ncbi:hypothetical protein BH09ACT10_BH09ACT10_30050 [soil metagenome]